MHPAKYGIHHPQQQLMEDHNDSSASSFFSIANPYQQSFFLHQQQKQIPKLFHQHSSLPVTQIFQHHNHQFQQVDHVQQQQQPFLAVNFKLALNENALKKDGTLGLNHQQQQHSLLMSNCWNPQEDSPPIKEPFWTSLSRCEDKDRQYNGDEENKYNKVLQQLDQFTTVGSKNLDNKYRSHFGELEAIYSLAKGIEPASAGSGSALTGENSPSNAVLSMPLTEFEGNNVGTNGGVANVETSIGGGGEEEASTREAEKKRRKRKRKEQVSLMVRFFESLVKQVMDHQESLHKRFMEVIDRLDKERTEKEESWRRRETEKRNKEAIVRANEQALASNREARIVSCLEQITGQRIKLPTRNPLLLQQDSSIVPFTEPTPMKVDNNSRWPRAEVEALIQVRCNLESRFREPGLKGPLWEDVSSLMCSLGYQRCAKRCKEKWENINKYFRKSKENGRKRSKQSKTCPYFDHLDQLYSRFPISSPSSPKPLVSSDIEMQQQEDSDFLEAYIPGRGLEIVRVDVNGSFRISDLDSSKLGSDGDNVVINGSYGKNSETLGDPEGDDDDDDDRNNEG